MPWELPPLPSSQKMPVAGAFQRCPILGMAQLPHGPRSAHPGGCDERQEQSFAFFSQLYFGVFSLEQLPGYLDQYIMWDDKCPHGFNHPTLFLAARGLLLSDLAFLLGTRWGLGLGSDLRGWWITVFLLGGASPHSSVSPTTLAPSCCDPLPRKAGAPSPIAWITPECTAGCQVPESCVPSQGRTSRADVPACLAPGWPRLGPAEFQEQVNHEARLPGTHFLLILGLC